MCQNRDTIFGGQIKKNWSVGIQISFFILLFGIQCHEKNDLEKILGGGGDVGGGPPHLARLF